MSSKSPQYPCSRAYLLVSVMCGYISIIWFRFWLWDTPRITQNPIRTKIVDGKDKASLAVYASVQNSYVCHPFEKCKKKLAINKSLGAGWMRDGGMQRREVTKANTHEEKKAFFNITIIVVRVFFLPISRSSVISGTVTRFLVIIQYYYISHIFATVYYLYPFPSAALLRAFFL